MTPALRVLCAAALAAFALSGCNKEKAPATTASASASTSGACMDPNTPVAEIDGQKLTLADADKEIAGQLGQLEKQMFQLRKQGVDVLINERLVKAEAQKKGMTEQQYLDAEIESGVKQPSEEEVKKLFDESASRLPPGSTLEQFRGQIVDFLTRNQKQQKAKELFERLRKEHNVKVLLTEPRVQVAATGPAKGPNDAKITIVEFSDFECPFCSRANETVRQVMDSYAGKVKLVFRHFPLSFHPNAQKAGEASMCADEQGKFWEMHDLLFANQKALGVDQLKGYAQQLGLDTAKFNECLDTGKKAQQVKDDMAAGEKAGVTGTPAFFINGIPLSGAVPFEEFKAIIDQELQGS